MTSKESFPSRKDDLASRHSVLMLLLILFGSLLAFAFLIVTV